MRTILGTMLATSLVVGQLAAQQVPVPSTTHRLAVDSKYLDHDGDTSKVVFSRVIQFKDVPWIRLFFDKTNLPVGSKLRITSLDDKATQFLDGVSIVDYGMASCFLNGGAVRLDLVAGPKTKGNRVLVVRAVTGVAGPQPDTPTICGPNDDRVKSSDRRQGRLSSGCTAWLASVDGMVTAGHCFSGSSSFLVEFNVPNSTSGGTIRRSHPNDQYAVIPGSYTGLNAGIGKDWGVGKLAKNSNTNKLPGTAQGGWYTLGVVPGNPSGQTARITGYGTSAIGSLNQVQKTHQGPMVRVALDFVTYATDTTGGNSGSPVIDKGGKVMGIHTHGACHLTTYRANIGTRIDRPDLQNAIQDLTKQPGQVRSFGLGCKGGRDVPHVSVFGKPNIKSLITIQVKNLMHNARGLMIFGLSNTQQGSTKLPLDLTFLGMVGCSQLVSMDVVLSLTARYDKVTTSILIPNVPSAVGKSVFLQYASHDQNANPGHTTVSQGVQMVIGK